MDPPAATQVALEVGIDQPPDRLIGIFLVVQHPQAMNSIHGDGPGSPDANHLMAALAELGGQVAELAGKVLVNQEPLHLKRLDWYGLELE
jgi:hypothetical protein